MEKRNPERLRVESLGRGDWLEIKRIYYRDQEGHERDWESADRVRCDGASVMIATLKPSRKLVLIRQYRPAVDKYIIEFPAGLIETGDTPEATALRELVEETGYYGTIVKSYPPTHNSPGMTAEKNHQIVMEIDENDPRNQNPDAQLDHGEYIETFTVPLNELEDFLKNAAANGDKLDSKVVSCCIALNSFS